MEIPVQQSDELDNLYHLSFVMKGWCILAILRIISRVSCLCPVWDWMTLPRHYFNSDGDCLPIPSRYVISPVFNLQQNKPTYICSRIITKLGSKLVCFSLEQSAYTTTLPPSDTPTAYEADSYRNGSSVIMIYLFVDKINLFIIDGLRIDTYNSLFHTIFVY